MAAMEKVGGLFVGINKFKYFDKNNLSGCVNDCRQMSDLVGENFGDAMRIELIDKAATKEAIMRSLDDLLAKYGRVYFSISSHGSRIKDRNGDEPDKLDGIYICHDTDTSFKNAIVDDELGELLAKYRGRKVIAFLDTCHSGEGLKVFQIKQGRFLQRRFIPNFGAKGGDVESAKKIKSIAKNVVLWTACGPGQYSNDAYIDGGYHGAFTFHWVKVVQMQSKLTRQRILKELNWMSAFYDQTPELVAKLADKRAVEFK